MSLVTAPSHADTLEVPPVKRKRGRPRKVPIDPTAEVPASKPAETQVKINHGSDDSQEEGNSDDDDDDDQDRDPDYRRPGSPSGVRRSSRRTKSRISYASLTKDDDDEEEESERLHIKRGRPPTLDKPHEFRIKAVMRALRRARIGNRILYLPFERLPDVREYPEYYQVIKNPIALDSIMKKIKRREYPAVDEFLRDLQLMFKNAKDFNDPSSLIYRSTATLEKHVFNVAEEEIMKPDSAYQTAHTHSVYGQRIRLDGIDYNGETYRVGDWVHILNRNDASRPIVGQIFRTWQTSDDRRWINACWYYRPEQTVHRSDRLFYEQEVVKSSQYRDHPIEDVIDKCYVQYVTKYQRGRPVGFSDDSVYCCEYRYNESEKTFNKIKTWRACHPDEVRSFDYEMDLFPSPRILRKVSSPILHLLPPNARDDGPVPDAVPGLDKSYPPPVGAVYKRPPDPLAHESPAPELLTSQNSVRNPLLSGPAGGTQHGMHTLINDLLPAIPSDSTTLPAAAAPSVLQADLSLNRFSSSSALDSVSTEGSFGTLSAPATLRPEYSRYNSDMSTPGTPGTPATPGTPSTPMYSHQGYGSHTSAAAAAAAAAAAYSAQLIRPSTVSQGYNPPPPPPSTFTLPDYITDKIPAQTAALFQKDESGKLLWFSVPPVDTCHIYVLPNNPSKGFVGHSVEFLSRRKSIMENRKRRAEQRQALFALSKKDRD
ncbi:uncharacterized protein V1516DRAFT_667456 [Lipomyces oligophaga]|uniref:uncharacterized protein n=1 Tax=Lipomyces oligophaga TaxID=45792 RepID=UPI0034CE902E